MKKTEQTASKTETKAVTKTVMEPEVKPEADKAGKLTGKPKPEPKEAKAEKTDAEPKANPESAKADHPGAKSEAKPKTDKADHPGAESEAKPKTAKSEKPTAEPKAKPESAKADNPDTKSEAKPITAKAEKPTARLKVKPEEAKAVEPEVKSKPAETGKTAATPEIPTETVSAVPAATPPAQIIESPLKRMKQEFTERTNVIKREMRSIQNSFLVIGFQLHWIKSNNMYRVLNYKNIMDYAEKEFGIKKSTCCNFINIIENFAERDENNEVIESIADCYRNFSSSQLIAMIGMPEEIQQQVTPDMTVRTIQRLRKGEPETPPVDAPKAVITGISPAAAVTPAVTAKPASAAPVVEKPAAPETSPVPSPISVAVHKADTTAQPAAITRPVVSLEKHTPRTLLEVGSYSRYRSMLDKIDGMVKDVFSTGKQMKVKIVCEEG